MSELSNDNPGGGCPLGFGGKKPKQEQQPLGPAVFRPRSRRVGIGALTSVHWTAVYRILEWFNRALAFNPYRKFSWDKWPAFLGLLYFLAKLRYLRTNALNDPYDFATNDNDRLNNPPLESGDHYAADGRGDVDTDNKLMGATLTRLSSDWPVRYVRPDVENMRPETHIVGKKLRHRKIDPDTDREIMTPAIQLSLEAMAEIQFDVHDFAPQTMREPISQCPFMIPRKPEDNFPNNVELIDRGEKDPTRITDNGRPTRRTQVPHRWALSVIYGPDIETQHRVRAFTGGKLKLDVQGMLPEDLEKLGIPVSGFTNNFSAWLDTWHYRWTLEHNAICDYYAFYHPDWDDEFLFQMSRIVNAGLLMRYHTELWTALSLFQSAVGESALYKDWNGMLGKKNKLYWMRQCHRHPWLNWLMKPVRNTDLFWGMPGSKWTHHDGPFQVPVDFRLAYFLHELAPTEIEILEPGTDRLLERIKLLDFVMHNSRSVIERHGYAAVVYSLNKATCGALVLHNLALALTNFQNQQNNEHTDLSGRDLFRTREDGGSWTYNQVRVALGEAPVASFMELTGGNQVAADEISLAYEGDINKVDALIGYLAGPKPDGFALELIQYYQFVINATRRFCSNKFMTDEHFNYKFYQEGMNWLQHRGRWVDLINQHIPELEPETEGVSRDFSPWPPAREFPDRLLLQLQADNTKVFKTERITWVVAAVATGLGLAFGAISPWVAAVSMGALSVAPLGLAFKRMLAMRFMQIAWRKSTTDKAPFYFGTLYKGQQWINRAAFFGRKVALLVTICGAALAWSLAHSGHPWVAALYALVALTGLPTLSASKQFTHDAHLLMIVLRNLMRKNRTPTEASDISGASDMERAYWFLRSENDKPVATIGSIYRKLRQSGEPLFEALGTAVASGLFFTRKTKKGVTRKEKRAAGIGPFGFFKIYLPRLHQVIGKGSGRWYAKANNQNGVAPGNIDMKELDKAFMDFAPGRTWMEAWDFARKREEDHNRDAKLGIGNVFSRWFNRLSMKRRHKQLIELYANKVKISDKRNFVPAITKDELVRVLNGSARVDLWRENRDGDTDPSPALWLQAK